MHLTHPPRTRAARRIAAGCCAATAALGLWAASPASADARGASAATVVRVDGGAVRGTSADGRKAFLGVPYAAPPVGRLRWHAPRPVAPWHGILDATSAASSCPQRTGGSEDCLYLNVYVPAAKPRRGGGHPVLVWIHGGGLSQGQGADYDPSALAADGTVVVTVNYRLGALGFLAHPALADRRGASGNYGLMDQQAALRWVRRNIRAFGGDARNVTLAGQSAGGLSVLAHLASRGSRGLFRRAIVQSGSFALTQQPLRVAEADGKTLAARAGCPDQSAECLRELPAASLVKAQGIAEIPGVVDGSVLRESVGTALASGRFNRVPIINGTNLEEERVFVSLGLTISGGHAVPLPTAGITPASYEPTIAAAFGVPAATATRIAAEYPLDAYPSAALAFSALDSDANFSCPALTMNRWTSRHVPTYAYEFGDTGAPERFAPPDPALPSTATHQSELQYLFGLPTALPGTLNGAQEMLAATMRRDWARFAATGAPPSSWPAFGAHRERMLSLVPSGPRVQTRFSARHHCGFWAGLG